MANKTIYVYENGSQVGYDSNANTWDFLSVKIGADGLEIKETATGQNFDFGTKKLTNIGAGSDDQDAATYKQLTDGLGTKISSTEKGANSGVATLDSGGKIPASQLPNSVMEYKGNWDASTNNPTLANGTGNAGDVYKASVAGTVDFGAGGITFAIGDFAIYSGSIWEKSLNSNAVVSVNSQTGAVVLDTDDISETGTPTNKWFTDTRAKAAAVVNTLAGSETDQAPSVSSVNTALSGKSNTGHVHSSSDITNFATDVKSAAVADSITDGVTDVAPSQNAVFDALALKADVANTDPTATVTNDNASAITVGQVVYVKTNGHVDLAANTLDLSLSRIGLVAAASIASAASGKVTFANTYITDLSGLTPGKYYVGTAGAMTSTLPTGSGKDIVEVGDAITSSVFYFNPKHIIKLA